MISDRHGRAASSGERTTHIHVPATSAQSAPLKIAARRSRGRKIGVAAAAMKRPRRLPAGAGPWIACARAQRVPCS
jgi:hypothetical protein